MSRRARARFDRRVILNPVAVAIENAALLSPIDRDKLRGIVDVAADDFRRGRHCAEQWCVLADALSVAEALAGLGIASDVDSTERISAAQAVLATVHQRYAARGTWTLHAAELQALDEGLWTHGVQLQHCSAGEYERAVRTTAERMRQVRAGNAPAGAVVCVGDLQ